MASTESCDSLGSTFHLLALMQHSAGFSDVEWTESALVVVTFSCLPNRQSEVSCSCCRGRGTAFWRISQLPARERCNSCQCNPSGDASKYKSNSCGWGLLLNFFNNIVVLLYLYQLTTFILFLLSFSGLFKATLGDYKLVFDSVYTPRKTRLLKEAEAAGAITVSGVEMFLRQAIGQFNLFTGGQGELIKLKLWMRLSITDWQT